MSTFTTAVKLFGENGVSATTAGTSTDVFDVSQRALMSIELVAGSQNAVFEAQISNDGVNFVTYNRLTPNITNTNAQNDTGVSSASVTAGQSLIYFIRAHDTFRYIRGSVTLVGTDSVFNATLHGIDT